MNLWNDHVPCDHGTLKSSEYIHRFLGALFTFLPHEPLFIIYSYLSNGLCPKQLYISDHPHSSGIEVSGPISFIGQSY